MTIFIGGNHEASNFLQELPFGGWVAPKIYYLGYAGVVNYKGLRIGGISGIYKIRDYFRGHFESPPYNNETLRSVYHYREQEIFRLRQLNKRVDIMMSHDWPTDVYYFGDADALIERKSHFDHQIRDNILGSPPLYGLLKKTKPRYWFSGHLHCKFAAVIPHDDENEDRNETKFLGLSKCLPGHEFLQVLDINGSDSANDCNELRYDLEWLTILYTTKHLMRVERQTSHINKDVPADSRREFRPTEEEKDAIRLKFSDDHLVIPKTFAKTAAPYDPENRYAVLKRSNGVVQFRNPQTVELCNTLDIDDPLDLIAAIIAGQEVVPEKN